MLLWATAAFMNRRSRMAKLIAAVPTAAHAAWRMNWRRDRAEAEAEYMRFNSVDGISESSLDGEIGGVDDEMNDGANAIPHLGEGRWCAVRQSRGVIDDLCLCGGGQLTGAEKRIESIDQPRNAGVCGVALRHPGSEVNHDRAAAIVKAAQTIRIARVAQHTALQEVHLESNRRVRGQLELGRCHTGGSERPWEFVVGEEKVENSGRVQRCLGQTESSTGVGGVQHPGVPGAGHVS